MGCHYTCLTCNAGASTNCLSCPIGVNRTTNGNTCPCAAGYYDTTVLACSTCHHSCATCISGNT